MIVVRLNQLKPKITYHLICFSVIEPINIIAVEIATRINENTVKILKIFFELVNDFFTQKHQQIEPQKNRINKIVKIFLLTKMPFVGGSTITQLIINIKKPIIAKI